MSNLSTDELMILYRLLDRFKEDFVEGRQGWASIVEAMRLVVGTSEKVYQGVEDDSGPWDDDGEEDHQP